MDLTIGQLLRVLSASMTLVGLYNKSGFVRDQYRERLQTLFQGLPSMASQSEIANEIGLHEQQELSFDSSDFSRVTPVRYRELTEFLKAHHLPFFIFNATVLVERSKRHMLWPTSFEFTALDVGSDACGYRAWDDLKKWEVVEHRSKDMSIFPKTQPATNHSHLISLWHIASSATM